MRKPKRIMSVSSVALSNYFMHQENVVNLMDYLCKMFLIPANATNSMRNYYPFSWCLLSVNNWRAKKTFRTKFDTLVICVHCTLCTLYICSRHFRPKFVKYRFS